MGRKKKAERPVVVVMLVSESDAEWVQSNLHAEHVWSAPVDPRQFEQIDNARRIGTQAGIGLYQKIREKPAARKG